LPALIGVLPAVATAQSTETPPPTPVPVAGGSTSPSPFPSALRTPAPRSEPPEVRAGAAVLADLDTGQVLYGANQGERLPIASLTKIMTALVTLERARPSEVVTVSAGAADPGPVVGVSQLGLVPGERITVEQLLYALLLQSANDAALALAEHVSGTVESFVTAMNRRAQRLGLTATRFASPNGLDDVGYSSAGDLAAITRAAFDEPLFAQIVETKYHTEPPPQAGGVPRTIQNRNVLLWLYPGATGVKTGFTSAAGFCVVATAERNGLRLVAVVLGEPAEPFSDAAALLNYGFTAFEHREVVGDGQDLGTVMIGGRSVPVASGATLVGLVPTGAEIRQRVSVRAGVTFPPGVGQMVGRLVVSVPSFRVGRVPIVVVAVPGPPPPTDPGPWWRRAGSSVLGALDAVLDALFG
jgi:D-alanyl-D-alanine carboxypeptidase (penicillin-binding protein 5/6)